MGARRHDERLRPRRHLHPVNITGDGVHELEVRIVDNLGRVNNWHTHLVKIDTVNPVDNTTVAAGWLPLGHLDVLVRGADTHSQVQGVEWRLDGGDVLNASANNHEVRVAGNGVHTLETRIVDNADRRSGWTVHTIKLDAGLPTNTTPVAPTGWRNTPYSVVLNGTDGLSGVSSVNHTIQLDGEPEGDEHEGTRNVTRVELEDDGEHILRTRVRDNAGNYSAWRPETIRIDRVVPTDDTVYPSAPVGNRHIVTFDPEDDRSGVAGIEWKLEDGVVKTTPTARITGEGEHTLSVRVQDLAGNWSAWGHHQITVVLGIDSISPTDETVIPSAWQLVAYKVTVNASDDIDGKGVDYVQWRYGLNQTGQGPAGSQFTITEDGEHEIETRAVDKAGNASPWKRQTLLLDTTQPVETTVMPGRWTNQNTITLHATDATSGLANLEYKIDNGAPISAPDGTTVTLPGDGTYRLSHRALDNAGQSSGWKVDEFTIDTVAPVNTSAAAPTTWQKTALALPLTGTDAASGVDRGEWRVSGGTIQSGSTTAVTTEGAQTLETRIVDKAGNVSTWRSENIRIDRTKPVNTTPVPTGPWRKTNYTATVSGTDASPGSGVARVEYKIDNGSAVLSPGVSITTEGPHKLYTRVVDTAGNESAWREDTIGIDKTVPALTVDCGQVTWRNTPATCTVTAEGGVSGLQTLTVTRGNGVAEPIGGSYTVEADGASKLSFRAVDGAGNEKITSTEVKVDRTPPAASVSCAPGGGTIWVCKGTGSDSLSGHLLRQVLRRRLGPDDDRRRRLVQRPEGQRRGLRDRRGRQHRHLEPAQARRSHAGAAGARQHQARSRVRRADPAVHDPGGPPAQGRRGLLAPAGPARALHHADQDDRRPAAARARQGHVPVRGQGHDGQEVQDLHEDPDDQEGLLDEDDLQRLRGLDGHGHADRQPEVGQALGHLRRRHGEAEVTREG